jgi:hypothetical protein
MGKYMPGVQLFSYLFDKNYGQWLPFRVWADPETGTLIILKMTRQEEFEWDREHFGEAVALENWRIKPLPPPDLLVAYVDERGN